MIRMSFIAALTLLTAAPSLPQTVHRPASAPSHREYRPIESIRWSYGKEAAPGSTWQLRFKHGQSDSSIEADPDVGAVIEQIAHAEPGQAIAFNLAREAGTIACTGHAEPGGRGAGTCRFDPDLAFAGELVRRGLAPQGDEEMLALALVNAHLAVADGLAGKGFSLDSSGDFIAVSALGVTPAFADELHDAGLKVDELGDLIALKALKVDSGWLADMARAGYPHLAAGQAIQMRALGVTPDYAVRMAHVLRAVGEIQ